MADATREMRVSRLVISDRDHERAANSFWQWCITDRQHERAANKYKTSQCTLKTVRRHHARTETTSQASGSSENISDIDRSSLIWYNLHFDGISRHSRNSTQT